MTLFVDYRKSTHAPRAKKPTWCARTLVLDVPTVKTKNGSYDTFQDGIK